MRNLSRRRKRIPTPDFLKPSSSNHSSLDSISVSSASASSSSLTVPTLHPFWAGIDIATSTREDDLRRKRQWRIDSDQIALIRESAKRFEGTHNFHNFTTGRDFSDKSNQRHMKKIEVGFFSLSVFDLRVSYGDLAGLGTCSIGRY